MATVSNTVVVDLGAQRKVVEDRVKSGSYASADEVIQAGLRALAREEADTDAWLIEIAEEAEADPRPSVPADEVFRALRAKYGREAKMPVRPHLESASSLRW